MGSPITLSTVLLRRLLAEAAASPRVEVCGLLLGAADRIDEARACRNVSTDPARAFEIDPAALLAAHRVARAGGPAVIGCYHSHPGGDAAPSPRDAAAAAPDGQVWIIVAGNVARAWRAVPSGAVQGRFDPLPLVALA